MDERDRTFSPVSQEFSVSKRLESGINSSADDNDSLPAIQGVQDSAADGYIANTDTTELEHENLHIMAPGMEISEVATTQSSPAHFMTAGTSSQLPDSSRPSEVQWPASFYNIESQHPAMRKSMYPSLSPILPNTAVSSAFSTTNTPSTLLVPTTSSQVSSTVPRLPQSCALIKTREPNAPESSLLPQPQHLTNNSSSRIIYLNLATTRVNKAGQVDLVNRNLLQGIRRGFAIDVGKIRSIPALNSFLSTYFQVTLKHYGLNLHHMSGYAGSFYSNTKGSYSYHLGPASTQKSWTTIFDHIVGRCMPKNHCGLRKCAYCCNPPFIFACIDEVALRNALLSKDLGSSTDLQFLDKLQSSKSMVPVITGTAGQAGSDNATEARKLQPTEAQYIETAPTTLQAAAVTASRKRSATLDENDAPTSKKLRLDSENDAESQDAEDDRDWSKATPKPTGTIKAETDTCLTCIQYKRLCKGTTIDQNGKCQNCQGHGEGKKSKRKCFWQNRPAGVITYKQARKDNGRCWDLPQNTREGIAERTRGRTPSTNTSDLVQDTLASLPNHFPAIDSQAIDAPSQYHTPTDPIYTTESIGTDVAGTNALTYNSIMGDQEESLGLIDQEGLDRAFDEWSNTIASGSNRGQSEEEATSNFETIEQGSFGFQYLNDTM